MQLFLLQTPLRRIIAAVLMIGALVGVSSCKNDDDAELLPVTVTFPANGSINIAENAEATTINLALSGPASKDGKISITASANATGVITFDQEISVTKGNTVAILHIDPTDNTTIDGTRAITFTISNVTDGFKIGDPSTYKVNVTDNEGPTTADFAASTGSVSEAATNPATITIGLSPKATTAGSVTVSITPATAAITTSPAATNGVITVPVAVNAESVSFTVLPTNNTTSDGDVTVKFTITEGANGVQVGAAKEYTLTIVDDDAIEPVTILSVREMYKDADVSFTEDIYIKGVVTSVSAADGNVAPSGLYMQDASGAIPVFFAANHGVVRGKEILVNLKGAKLTNFGGYLLEVTATPNENLAVLGDKSLPAPKVITVTQLKSGDYESQLVRLNDVFFPDADGIITMGGTRAISDGTVTSNIFTRSGTSGASFQGSLVPLGKGTVTGIASDFTSGAQLLPQVFSEDIFASNPTGTITTTATNTLDFGSVAKGAKSAEQTYTVTGTGPNAIIVTASDNYQVSSTSADADFGTTATLDKTGGTVHVRFAPNTGENKVITGTIVTKSVGSASAVVNVTGTETGGGAAYQTLAFWTFESLTTYTSTSGKNGQESDIVTAEDGIIKSASTAKGFHTSTSTLFSSPAGNGTPKSLSSNNWGINDYYQFSLNSTGYQDIKISWDQTGSGSGPKVFVLQYSIDGSSFTQVGSEYNLSAITWSAGTPTTSSAFSFDLSSITATDNAATLMFRIVNTSTTAITGTNPVGTSGTGRIDNVKIEARPQ